ncbi:hypothetical protein BT93_L1463 [Corymbia citriodora subsp. variegata]|uniref:NADH:quinone oxidoreductase/Mrp antiporter transmembrane domain-containing protein n=1 Tax=Corymbia citriodora subsp. variegata TaxID=360336 RepID=A0A8T0CQ29_CORYI|nr:hypothetical protein BT93_L1463 [Corymbia citriodora subsp. variegata]
MWAPDIYEGSPTPVTAFLSIAPKISISANISRVSIYGSYGATLQQIFFFSEAFLATIVLFFNLLCLKIGLICFTYDNFYQFFFYSSKFILIPVEITALALSYHLTVRGVNPEGHMC